MVINSMTDERFCSIMNDNILCDQEEYIHRILKDFKRFSTNFQLLPLKDKILSHYMTSLSIKYGYALEKIIEEVLIEKGASFLNRKTVPNKDCDQIFIYNDKIFLIEQKIRDDHDSSKKVGQIENYLEKKEYLINNYKNFYASCCWFIDNSFHKNEKYYKSKIPEEIYYGNEIENFLKEVFKDNRCDNFYNWLLKECAEYRSKIKLEQNLKIEYRKYTCSEIYNLLENKNLHSEIGEIFFDNKIPYKEILLHVKQQKNSAKKEALIKILEEI